MSVNACMPLLHSYQGLLRHLGLFVFHRYHSWLGLLLISYFGSLHGDLPYIFWGQTSAIVIVYNALGVSWITLTNTSNRRFSCLVLEVLLDGLWLFKGVLSE